MWWSPITSSDGKMAQCIKSCQICHLCDSADIGDEFHYIMSCNHLKQEREKYLPSYSCSNFNTFKLYQLCFSCNVIVLEKLCTFINMN